MVAETMTAPAYFGTDGIRGIAGVAPLEKPFIRRLGAAAAAVYKTHVRRRAPVFLLGRDTRESGQWIAQAFAEGAASQGVKLRDAGVISTPALAYLVPHKKMLGGVMISASHNPAEFNGIKLFNPEGRKCPDTWEKLIEEKIAENIPVPESRLKLQKDPRAIDAYLKFLKTTLPPRTSFKGLKLVVDCSHGSLSKIAPAFLRGLGATVIPLGTTPNGKNINAGCGSQVTAPMQREVVARKADGGLAFDGDADRIILCDEQGRLLDGDFIIASAAKFLQEEKKLPANTVIVTVMANLGLMKRLESWGLRVLTTQVGDRFVSEQLDKEGAALGGEQSGHVIFHRYLPTGDGLLTGLQILSHLRKRKLPMSWMYGLFTRYPQVLLNVEVKEKKPLKDCTQIQQEISNAERRLNGEGRVFVRYSGTEPLLRIMMEGPDEAILKTMAASIADSARATLGAA